jgi:hypothetical protein
VMFCDLVGSTALSARLDPEDLRDIVGAYHTVVAEAIGRFGGFVAKYMGDGVLAYFGYPQAHEDDAERAVRAGLAVVGAIRPRDLLAPVYGWFPEGFDAADLREAKALLDELDDVSVPCLCDISLTAVG